MRQIYFVTIFATVLLGIYSSMAFADEKSDFMKSIRRNGLLRMKQDKKFELIKEFYKTNSDKLIVKDVTDLAKELDGFQANWLLTDFSNKRKDKLSSREWKSIGDDFVSRGQIEKADEAYELSIQKKFLDTPTSTLRTKEFLVAIDKIHSRNIVLKLVHSFYEIYKDAMATKPNHVVDLSGRLYSPEANDLLTKHINGYEKVMTPVQLETLADYYNDHVPNSRRDEVYETSITKKYLDKSTFTPSDVDKFVIDLRQVNEDKIKATLIEKFYKKHKTHFSNNTRDFKYLTEQLSGSPKNALVNLFMADNAKSASLDILRDIAKHYTPNRGSAARQVKSLIYAREHSTNAIAKCIKDLRTIAN